MHTRTRSVVCLMVFVLAAGCSQHGPIKARGAEEGTEADRRDSAVLISRDLADTILVERSSARRTGTGTWQVSFVMQNATDDPQQVESRVHFLTQDDAESEPPSAWYRTHLPPNSFETVVVYSTSSD